MVSNGEYLAIYNSIHRVMKAEKVLKDLRLPILLIPAPRELSTDCGLAIRYAVSDKDRVERAMKEAGVVPEAIYLKQLDHYVPVSEVTIQHDF